MENSKKLFTRRKVLKMGAISSAALTLGILPGQGWSAEAAITQNTPVNPNQIGFKYNQQKCIGCKACQAACKSSNKWEEGTVWRRVLAGDSKGKFLSISCNHCENPACVTVCPVKAYEKREKDGIVLQNPEKCVGCKYCMYACPYHAPQFSENSGRISKCHFCYERQDNGEDPACVSVCPTGALTYGKLAEIRKTQGGVTQIGRLPEYELTKPSWVIIPKE